MPTPCTNTVDGANGGQTDALCILPCQRDAEPGEPLHLAQRDNGWYTLA